MNLVKKVHEVPLRKFKALNPNYERVWSFSKFDDGSICFAYYGTPDKGFVIVTQDYRIFAHNQWGKLIKIFE